MLGILLLVFAMLSVVSSGGYKYDVKYMEVPLDHFSFGTNATFKLRYLYNASYWHEDGPIFFYTGNEGDIDMFAQNTGFVWELAPEFGALIVFAEHRYYGASMPFGNDSFSDPSKTAYLTSTQALADFVWVIDAIKKSSSKGREAPPVVAFGGSYGGMLAAWMRMKYPDSVIGAVASSAPILQFETPCHLYDEVVTKVFKISSQRGCERAIKNSWRAIRDLGSTNDGRSWLSATWSLCRPLETSYDVDVFVEWLTGIYGDLTMVNYPYPTDFLAPLPAYPVKRACQQVRNASAQGKPLLEQIQKVTSIYLNYTGQVKCVDVGSTAPQSKLDDRGWDFQACTEMVMPMCSAMSSMFETQSWNYTLYVQRCQQKWKVRAPRPDLAVLEYGSGANLKATSNIVFSNGLLDPWSAGGVLQNISKSVLAVLMPEAAHHLDLRASNPLDPRSVIDARNIHRGAIYRWLREHRGKGKKKAGSPK